MNGLSGRKVIVGVDAGPTAFEAPDLVRRLVRSGAQVWVAMTPEARRWVTPLTLETVSARPLLDGPGDDWPGDVDLLVVFPAGPGVLAELAGRRSESSVGALAAHLGAPVLVAPGPGALDDAWVQAHASAIGEVLEAGVGAEGVTDAAAAWCGPRDFLGRVVWITAGPTREPLDPVRFLSNPSSGKMGVALADAARRRGAEVVLFLGPTDLPVPRGVQVVRFETAQELDAVVQARSGEFDVFVAAAAVADWTPAEVSVHKVKKSGEERTLRLVRTPDVLARLSARTPPGPERPVLVGFAAETENLEEYARAKLTEKSLDLVVANHVKGPDGAFGAPESEAVLVGPQGAESLGRQSKRRLAGRILDHVAGLLTRRPVGRDTPRGG